MLAFRAYLRVHPQALETYAGIKRDLAERHPHDIKAYTQGKAFFVESCIRAVREAQAPVADAPPGQVGREITAYYGKNREVERLIAGSGQLERVRVQELLRCQLPAPPAVILDVGGGPGTHSTWLAQDGYAVHLIDPMENLLEDACQAFAALSEARRVVRAGGVVIAIGISKFASALDGMLRHFLYDPAFLSLMQRDLVEGQHRGECVPYARYGETMASVRAQIEALAENVEAGLSQSDLPSLLSAGAARNAIDCAMWDLQAKQSDSTVHALLGIEPPAPVSTAFTISLATAAEMGEAARQQMHRPLLKLKLAGDSDDIARVAAVRQGAPLAGLVVDANEGGSAADVEELMARLAELDVALIEQPLRMEADEILADIEHTVALCADESCHTSADIERLRHRYDAVNIKLDKAGGLTEARALRDSARDAGLQIMVGCMVATSLAMAPALLLAQGAEFVDLDGPLLLARDRTPGLNFEGSLIHPAPADLWG